MTRITPGTVACVWLIAAPLLAQAPRQEQERPFFQAQVMRAIDEKASLLIDQGKPEAAAAELKRVLDIEVPKEHPAYEMKARLIGRLAITLTAAGHGKEGVETIQKLLSDVPPGSPAEAAAWLDAGVAYRQAGMVDDALKAFDKAIELAQKLAASGRPLPPGPPGGRRPRPGPNGGI